MVAMEISAISTSLQSNSLLTARQSSGIEKPHECDCDNQRVSLDRKNGNAYGFGRGAALQVFRAELRMSLKASFHAEFGASQPAYAANQESMTSDDVADEALAVAKNVVAQSPTSAAKSLIQFRSSLDQSVQVASKTVQSEADQADLDVAATKIDEGVAELEEQAVATRESSTTALSLDTSTRQKSMIKIRTQEGDIVRLSLRQATDLSASSSETVDGENSQKTTEIDFSSRSRMFVKVRGDLNAAEMGAIQSILGQAQEMADAFFGGDIGAAFSSAKGFEFDTDQLSRVKMRFSMRQESNIAFSQVTNTVSTSQVSEPVAAPTPEVVAPAPAEPVASEPVAPAVEVPAPSEVEAAAPPVVADDAVQGFFEMVGNFLRSVSEGFAEGASGTSIRYQYSESFKLSLLQSVINTVAPADQAETSDAAVAMIDSMSEAE